MVGWCGVRGDVSVDLRNAGRSEVRVVVMAGEMMLCDVCWFGHLIFSNNTESAQQMERRRNNSHSKN
jgi:hypothetical protein